jgi:hypothetical protein
LSVQATQSENNKRGIKQNKMKATKDSRLIALKKGKQACRDRKTAFTNESIHAQQTKRGMGATNGVICDAISNKHYVI